ncbi:MAG: class I SAM-dependent methyltransferase [Nocardioidaceae bacterium]|nr:MAG: class I SAM-dependent methyltransferase [Nocardioidaceae bacterium]
MDADLLAHALAAKGFMPPAEGRFLYEQATQQLALGPGLEVGTYCGKSAIYLGAAARETAGTVFTVDHHRGSEENQVGWEHHDSSLVDPEFELLDTLPTFRKTILRAGLQNQVVAIVGASVTVAAHWNTPLALLFIDGGHGVGPAHDDYQAWAPKVMPGGLMLIHDVFESPAEGGRPPYEIYLRALTDGFVETGRRGSMRALRAPC